MRVSDLLCYLCELKSAGYTFIGAKQIINGRSGGDAALCLLTLTTCMYLTCACIQVRVSDLLCYLCELKSAGYTLIGAEQIINGRSGGDAALCLLTLTTCILPVCRQVRVSDLLCYLCELKSAGYTLIGAEQTVNGRSLRQFEFPKKTALLLGYENLSLL